MMDIKRVAILGSGVMGRAIAAHFANCGVPSVMLDITPPDLSKQEKKDRKKRNGLVEANKKALLKAKPPALYLKSNVDLIETGNFDDDMPMIGDCDWIVEAVTENLDVKRTVFEGVAKHRGPDSIVSTNTSGIPIGTLAAGMDADMAKHFLGTHFFNPPRYLKLLELIPGPHTAPEVIETVAAFGEEVLGKGVVYAKDTPCFVANRIFIFATQYILRAMVETGLTPEDVDALTGPAIGHAKSATLRTADIVGLDTYLHILENTYEDCPNDERRDLLVAPDWLKAMVDKGLLGAKSGAGFYQKTKERDERGAPIILSIDFDTLEYSPQDLPGFECTKAARAARTLEEKVRVMHTGDDRGSQFLWTVFANTAAYAARRIPEIADDIASIDNAVKWGFAWDVGIFETWDMLGVPYVCDRMQADGLDLPPIAEALLDAGADSFYREGPNRNRQFFDLATKSYQDVARNPRVLFLEDVKKAQAPLRENDVCSLVDLGDGILCAEFHSKMNTLGPDLLAMVRQGVDLVNEGQFDGLVLGNQGKHFSAGFDLKLFIQNIREKDWDAIDALCDEFQQVNMAMRFCKGPVVSAPHNYTFGGGMEMAQHAARAVIAAETYGGLVESGVGLMPAGGGVKEMLRRALAYAPSAVPGADPLPFVQRAFDTIWMAKVSTSGQELVELGHFGAEDVVCVNWDHQLKRAKDLCRGLSVSGHGPPKPATLEALGEPAMAVLRATLYQYQVGGYASEHDVLIGLKLAAALTGGGRAPGAKLTEQDVLDLEREGFLSLCGTEKTKQRIEHMLETGKPLRN
ncbi:MAG TPA: 3-hydroxyacyl-CoA dehydrogenase/enoyl-CoA hydratase family protein [Candidatus Hydrogenedentes bacterium]|nr:3-hydroxyacyl-CoA dehydrogenase/enoyl-CoA hydratase family protein [Candidatus Hydrogenedentota bacterium]HIJ73494.1 3-hydroxyacyl-CoA dehydrogenase/enoyl-CoA hydratase family protein [Candidatus Hydrogenedentota bacterium]